ncbi:MAG TPA: 50S ribosomal protein L20 [Candidatus Saccharimonadales bacterium]|nr:50S ribosomal protein L20 [Candidatus Saccharimonadales bacterium]
MTRVKKGFTKRAKHKKILKAAKGYYGARSKLIRTAKEAVMHAGSYAYSGRKQRKQQARTLWITKINAALGEDVSYKDFIHYLNEEKVELDRKILAQIAESDPETFKKLLP